MSSRPLASQDDAGQDYPLYLFDPTSTPIITDYPSSPDGSLLDGETPSMSALKREIKLKTYQLNPEQTLFLGGLGCLY